MAEGVRLREMLTDLPEYRAGQRPAPRPDLVTYKLSSNENPAGALRFRLWESKKYTGSGSMSTSLNQAYRQIATSGQRYVAKIVGTFTPVDAPSFPIVSIRFLLKL